jgi:hypothetical protein
VRWMVVAVLAALVCLPCMAREPATRFEEVHLEGLLGPQKPLIRFNSDGSGVAYRIRSGAGCCIVVDGVKGPEVDSCQTLVSSPDGKRFAYAATRGGKGFVVVGGNKEKEYPKVRGPVFSPDGSIVAYNAFPREGKRVVVTNGVESREYDVEDVKHLYFPFYFSADGKHVGYFASRGSKQFVVVDGIEGLRHDRIQPPVDSNDYTPTIFSPDGKHTAYVSLRGQFHPGTLGEIFEMFNASWCAVVDGKRDKEYCLVTQPIFSADGGHVAYIAAIERETKLSPGVMAVVVDGKPRVVAGLEHMSFTPDGEIVLLTRPIGKRVLTVGDKHYESPNVYMSGDRARVAYCVKVGDQMQVIHVESTGPPPPRRAWTRFRLSPDGKRKAFIASREGLRHMVVDGKEGKGYKVIAERSVAFSVDGTRLNYLAANDGDSVYPRKAFVVMNGEEGEVWDSIHGVTFSPDGRRCAYSAVRGEKEYCVVDGNSQELDDGRPQGFRFSGDSEHLACVVTGAKRACYFVVDGVKSPQYDSIVRSSDRRPIWAVDTPSRLIAIVRRAGETYLLKVNME